MGSTIEFAVDPVTRLTVLETQLEHFKECQAQHTEIINALSNKIERLTSILDKVDITLPQFAEQVNALNKEFVAFKELYIQEQMRMLQEETTLVKQEAKAKEEQIKEAAESKVKTKLLWGVAVFIGTGIAGLLWTLIKSAAKALLGN